MVGSFWTLYSTVEFKLLELILLDFPVITNENFLFRDVSQLIAASSAFYFLTEGSRRIIIEGVRGKKILICSDSESSIDALSSCKFS